VTAELKSEHLDVLLSVFKNLLNDSTNIFKLEEITLNRNKTISNFLVSFIYFFSLLPDLVLQLKRFQITHKRELTTLMDFLESHFGPKTREYSKQLTVIMQVRTEFCNM
jgi:hypothetical protein